MFKRVARRQTVLQREDLKNLFANIDILVLSVLGYKSYSEKMFAKGTSHLTLYVGQNHQK